MIYIMLDYNIQLELHEINKIIWRTDIFTKLCHPIQEPGTSHCCLRLFKSQYNSQFKSYGFLPRSPTMSYEFYSCAFNVLHLLLWVGFSFFFDIIWVMVVNLLGKNTDLDSFILFQVTLETLHI